jgi:3'-phosphoadenosine 5'-phosphosulfate sulfotransferase (PAPS reductase)/FAD synthetase
MKLCEQTILDLFDPAAPCRVPLVVAYGMGVDSTAMLVGLQQRGEVPDLILFADTGDEKPETYAYLPTINAWLRSVGFPLVTVVKNARPVSGDKSLSDSCLRLGTLPALAYGMHQCSLVWKRDPQQAYIKTWQPAKDVWAVGGKVTTCIGYDAGLRDSCRQYKAEGKESPGYANRFPLIEWGWDRDECKRQIAAAGLPVPIKSACFHCPASKHDEIIFLKTTHPALYAKALALEAGAEKRRIAEPYSTKGKLKTFVGLGRDFSWAAA